MTGLELLEAITKTEADAFTDEVVREILNLKDPYLLRCVISVIYALGVRAGQPTYSKRAAIADSKILYYLREQANAR